jgi:endonuclease/exonuclease/phosphatase family metal-dependent hydrolase
VSPITLERSRTPARCDPRLALGIVLAGLLAVLAATPSHALRIVTWNLLAYDDAAVPVRRPHMLQIVPGLAPDVMIVQELMTAPAADSFANLLKATLPGRVWKGGSTTFILSTQSAIYYDSLAVSISNLTAVNTGGPRQVLVARVRPNGYKADAASFRLYSMHLKAGDGSTVPSDSSTRTLECTNLRNALNTAPVGTNLLLGGDSNFYGTYETGYTRLTESQADNDGRLRDPLTLTGVWNNPAYAPFHTQSPCAGSPCVGSSGGMDDRFDILLHSYTLNDGLGLDVVAGGLPGGYGPYGNDGQHYNQSLDGNGFNNAVGLAVAAALRQAADHIPVIATLQLPAKLYCESELNFGDVLTGAVVSRTLNVDDLPSPPAATLSYSLTAPAGFTAPGGPFTNLAPNPPAAHSIGMVTATPGVQAGTLTVSSNDLDTTSKAVLLSGRVLAHAVPSLDSLLTVSADTLDFGVVSQNSLTELSARVFNLGYTSLQSRLARTAEFIAGEGAFTFTAPAGLIPAAGTYAVRFDATGMDPDTDHNAELRLAPSDEALPGATAHDTLRLVLRAHVAGNDAVEGVPTALRFAPPAPNPLRHSTMFAFDLPQAAAVSLAIYDPSGRRVATLAGGEWPAGRHQVHWQPADRTGSALHAGLYFARFSTPGLTRVARLIVLP